MPVNYPFPVTHINLIGRLFFCFHSGIFSGGWLSKFCWVRDMDLGDRWELCLFGVVFLFKVLTSLFWGQKVFQASFRLALIFKNWRVIWGYFLGLAAFGSFEGRVFELR